ncbi:MAG: hypothetical protein Q9209_004736 [Squamulea sp. 1 TL-2023]
MSKETLAKLQGDHSALVYNAHQTLKNIKKLGKVEVDGKSLDIPSVVAVSKLADDDEFRRRIDASVATLNKLLYEGKTVYGVTTGFGGSADTRTNKMEALQSALLQHHHFGVLAPVDRGKVMGAQGSSPSPHAMPSEWVKGSMLVRSNTIARGHSAVSLHVIETIVALLRHDLTPVVPLRGSISASGDLSPLSYIAGAVTGNPDIFIQSGNGIITAEQALGEMHIAPIVLGPKEGLGLMNGTATSAAVASLAIYEAHHVTVLSQVLTAMALEALLGTAGNYDPFIAHIRPHRGQIECGNFIRQSLRGSTLVRGFEHDKDIRQSSGLLYQDRYALRTASQWIGPQLEDLLLAHEQVTIELNSTTDNPLIDVEGQTTHHGGNFQAVSITSAMEKTRLSLQMIGKLLFAQCSELINPMLNNGLPPNLAADEPSMSFTMKGVDIGMASYMSELAYLANSVSSHVQSAEMHNQAVNSLSFITTRYTFESVELVSLMSASYLYTVCQALDLRVLQRIFFQHLEPALYAVNLEILGERLPLATVEELHHSLWAHIQVTWLLTSNKDTNDRATYIIDMALAILTQSLLDNPQGSLSETSKIVQSWRSQATTLLITTYTSTRSEFFVRQNTADYLGCASRRMYLFVRQTLEVPFHKGLEDHPTPKEPMTADGSRKQTIGSRISTIYESLRDGRMHEPLMECLAEAGMVAGAEPADKPIINGIESNGQDTTHYRASSHAHNIATNGLDIIGESSGPEITFADPFTNGKLSSFESPKDDNNPKYSIYDVVRRQSIDEAVRKLSIEEPARKHSVGEAVRKHSIDEVDVYRNRRASLSLAHGSLTSL